MKKKIICSVSIIAVSIVLFVFMVVKGYPMIAVAKAENALKNKDGEALLKIYECNYGILTDVANDSVREYMSEWIGPVADDFNQQFTNFETQEVMDSYLKERYGTVFFTYENSLEMIIYNEFGKLNSIRASKIKSIEVKDTLDEYENRINEVRNRLVNLSNLSKITADDAIVSEQDAEFVSLSFELNRLDNELMDPYLFYGCVEDDANCVILKHKWQQLQAELEKLQSEYDEYNTD